MYDTNIDATPSSDSQFNQLNTMVATSKRSFIQLITNC